MTTTKRTDGDGADLLAPLRKHDLPPKWDGRPVKWHGWDAGQTTYICPEPGRECCHFCGSLEPAVFNRGSRRVIEGRDRYMPSLYAYRCPTCRRDIVEETGSDETWELEPDDYGDEGAA